jgi:hypothetical protein
MGGFFHNNSDLCSWLGLLISVVSTSLTVWTLRTARDIRTRILRRTQVPDLIKSLEKDLSELNALLLPSSIDQNAVRRLIRKSSVTIKSAHAKVKSPETRRALKMAKKVLKKDILTKDDGENFYTELTAVHEDLRLIKIDDDWDSLL